MIPSLPLREHRDHPTACRGIFAFRADFENVPKWNYAAVETTQASRGAGRGRNHLPPDPFDTERERRELRGDRLRTASLARDPRTDRALPREDQLRARATNTETRLRNAVDLGSSGLSAIVAQLATSRVKHAVAANLDTLKQLLRA